ANTGYFDMDQCTFPLIIRKWKKGDYFQPFGMQGLKKLSDYFIDQKFSIIDKEETWILASGEKIIWVIGHRTDDRFKIIPSSENILKISIT
ncbi:tRNA lysidine(34) synthetase TilS, partial [Bacteroidota bacterium]